MLEISSNSRAVISFTACLCAFAISPLLLPKDKFRPPQQSAGNVIFDKFVFIFLCLSICIYLLSKVSCLLHKNGQHLYFLENSCGPSTRRGY